MAITAAQVTSLVDAITKLIASDATDRTALAAAQQQVADLTAQEAALNDPALQASVDSALAAASAAEPADPPAAG